MDAVKLGILSSRLAAVCEEMGAVLVNTAFSPNIRDRLDLSCAVFDAQGELCAQAAHIPVHLGSMAYAMRDLVDARAWSEGDVIILNDPYLGGTHLPDVTVVAPVFVAGERVAFVADRAHHADIGADAPGSMPLATRLEEEGVVIPPTAIAGPDGLMQEALDRIVSHTRTRNVTRGDIAAQVAALRLGVRRTAELVGDLGPAGWADALTALDQHAERLARETLASIPDGCYRFVDRLDSDGQGAEDLEIHVAITVEDDTVQVDFTGTAPQAEGNVNCPLSVAAAAVVYAFRCLMPDHTPAVAGAFRPIRLSAPVGSLLNARRPAAVAAGNVETSMRVVDAVFGALAQAVPERIPAASQGTMNNVAMGSRDGRPWAYYETLAGGAGAGPHRHGATAVHSHMTNTRNTPIETLEMHYPLRVERYAIRTGSGGGGRHRGGAGLIRSYRLLEPASVSLLTERRRHPPWGLAGGEPGATGCNRLDGEPLPAKVQMEVGAGGVLEIATPGGGGHGERGITDI